VENLCGGCTECCTTQAVVEIGKPRFTKCAYDDGKGCSHYESRPEGCRQYTCAFIAPGYRDLFHMRSEDRPDKLGLVLYPVLDKKLGPMVIITVSRPGADEAYWGQKLINRLAKKHLVLLVKDEKTSRFVRP